MANTILDGTGDGYYAKVDSNNNLKTVAITTSEIHDAVHRGKTWNVGTGFLTLTGNATASGLLYIKNTGTKDLFVDLYVFLTRASASGSGDMLVEILRNPTGGTVVDDAIDMAPINMNFGSASVPQARMYSGGEAKTLTGEDGILRSLSSASNRLLLGILTLLPQGSSMGLRVTSPSGNTSMDIEAVVEMFEEV